MATNKAQGRTFDDIGAKPMFIHEKVYATFSRMSNFDCVKNILEKITKNLVLNGYV